MLPPQVVQHLAHTLAQHFHLATVRVPPVRHAWTGVCGPGSRPASASHASARGDDPQCPEIAEQHHREVSGPPGASSLQCSIDIQEEETHSHSVEIFILR